MTVLIFGIIIVLGVYLIVSAWFTSREQALKQARNAIIKTVLINQKVYATMSDVQRGDFYDSHQQRAMLVGLLLAAEEISKLQIPKTVVRLKPKSVPAVTADRL